MAAKNVTYPVTEVLGFCDAVTALLNNHKADMITKQVDPTAAITTIGTGRDALNSENTTQENIKTQLRDQTVVVDAAKATAYANASLGCDKLIAAYGRTSEVAKEAINLRKSLQHRPRTPETPTPPPPTP